MIKYATALRLGTAETEAILRRFTQTGLKHPTYQAFAELGRAVKTIFLCQYLQPEALRREINAGLNVIENWNGANSFIFYCFFFSSRRRHTRLQGDWSSDVCSSDLRRPPSASSASARAHRRSATSSSSSTTSPSRPTSWR